MFVIISVQWSSINNSKQDTKKKCDNKKHISQQETESLEGFHYTLMENKWRRSRLVWWEPFSQRASRQSLGLSPMESYSRMASGHAIIEQQQSETILSRQAQAIERQRFKGILHQSKASKSLWYQQELTSALLAAPGTLITGARTSSRSLTWHKQNDVSSPLRQVMNVVFISFHHLSKRPDMMGQIVAIVCYDFWFWNRNLVRRVILLPGQQISKQIEDEVFKTVKFVIIFIQFDR